MEKFSLRVGDLEIKLAENEKEIDAIQALRYQVFFEEMDQNTTPENVAKKRDIDKFDSFCDHLMVVDHSLGEDPLETVVGTYRLIKRDVAEANGGFYTSKEFDLTKLLENYEGNILELGRSCTREDYRSKTTISLLWQGLAYYIFENDIDLMFGVASAEGLDFDKYKEAFAYLYYNHKVEDKYCPKSMDYIAMDNVPADEINPKKAIRQLPPLVKGYLMVNGKFGDGLFLDKEFNSTDVFVMVETANLTDKYRKHYLDKIKPTDMR
ncbi:MAG: GNAT family N-acetyltransferase [Alphaproteobacteria bacterium]|jgi:putative hemolysin|nr:GNAT family N-acetyltransferase [Alphaproteobacteria bacterium]MCV6599689.1 GNAT family N-acetyltransferase [Alphaproteobacteria bacterium]